MANFRNKIRWTHWTTSSNRNFQPDVDSYYFLILWVKNTTFSHVTYVRFSSTSVITIYFICFHSHSISLQHIHYRCSIWISLPLLFWFVTTCFNSSTFVGLVAFLLRTLSLNGLVKAKSLFQIFSKWPVIVLHPSFLLMK